MISSALFCARLVLIITAVLAIATSCGNKTPKHEPFPDTLTVTKTNDHVRLRNSKVFVVPPEGFTKSREYGDIKYESGGAYFKAAHDVKETNIATTIEGIQQDVQKYGHQLLELKPITYNGLQGVYFEEVSMNKFYTAEFRVRLKDSSIFRVTGHYTYESSPETVSKIFLAMKQAFFDDAYTLDRTADQVQMLHLDDAGSRFKLSYVDTSAKKYKVVQRGYGEELLAGVKHKHFTYYYTLSGGLFTGVPPYLIMLDAPIIGGNYDYKYTKDYNFPSIANSLADYGFIVKRSGATRNFEINGKKARETLFQGTDISGTPVSVKLTEINTGYGLVSIIGVAEKGDDATLQELRDLAATLEVEE